MGDSQVADSPGSKALSYRLEVAFKVAGFLRQVDKNPAKKGGAGCALEGIVLFPEALGFIHIGSADEISIQPVGPGVVWTGDVFSELPGVA